MLNAKSWFGKIIGVERQLKFIFMKALVHKMTLNE